MKLARCWNWVRTGLIAVVLCVNLLGLSQPVFATEPIPLTPAGVKYELEHSKSPEAAGQKMQQMSKDYKQELEKSPTPIPNAVKNGTEKTKSLFKLFSKRVEETLDGDASPSQN